MNAFTVATSLASRGSESYVEELLLSARERRGAVGLASAFVIAEELALALQSEVGDDDLRDDIPYPRCSRPEITKRLLWKELGIWCYLAFESGANIAYLLQAEACLKKICPFGDNQRGADALRGCDIEVEMYLAFVLWSKWQNKLAQPGEMRTCFSLLSDCAQAGSFLVPRLETVWFRLGYLYQIGAGCSKDQARADECYAHARRLGLEC